MKAALHANVNSVNVESLSLLAAVFDMSTSAMHVLKSIRDAEGKIVDFEVILSNHMSEKIAGRKVTGMRMLEGWPHTKAIGLFDQFVGAVETGKRVDYEQYYQADGVTAWFRWVASRLDDGLYVTIEDISDRKRDEESLTVVANNLQSTFDGVPALIALLEPHQGEGTDFIISSGNKALADFSGLPVYDLHGRRITEVYPDLLEGDLLRQYSEVLRTGDPAVIEYYYARSGKWLSLAVSRQLNQRGLLVVGIDVTSTKKAEEEQRQLEILRNLDKLKTDFFNNVSHEFRTPLTLILGPIEDLLNNRSINGSSRTRLEIVHRNVLRLQKHVNTLLDISRFEAGKSDVIFQPTDLTLFTNHLASNFRASIERARLKFIVDLEPVEPVYVNRLMWEQITFNLLSNALKFTLRGEIKLQIKSNLRNVQLCVSDTGTGIESENLDRIFDRFTRVENAKARTFEGSGIGLALVKQLVEIHKGKIKVKSKVGRGSEFIVTIPKGKQHLPSERIHSNGSVATESELATSYLSETEGWLGIVQSNYEQGNRDKKFKVIVVDDNSDLRHYITSLLQYEFEVFTFENGSRAQNRLQEGLRPDLIISDIMMPEVDGFELLSFVRSQTSLKDIPFIFLTAKASERERVEGINKGVDSYLTKPFSPSELKAIIYAKLKSQEKKSAASVKTPAALPPAI